MMKMRTFTRDELKHASQLYYDQGTIDDESDYDDECDNAISYLLNMNDNVRAYMHALCALDVNNERVTFDETRIDVLDAFATLIIDEYDIEGDERDAQSILWRTFDLGGDDDVDYNGSHLSIAHEIITSHMKSIA